MDDEKAQYYRHLAGPFRIDSKNRFEATQILLKVRYLDEAETIKCN